MKLSLPGCIVLLPLFFGLLATARGQELVPTNGVPVGLLADFSGPARAYGQSLERGLRMAVDELNERGGWRGLPYRLLARDTRQHEGQSAREALDLLWNEKVLLLVGTTDSGGTHVVARNAMDARTVMVSTVATDPLLTRNGNPWFFRALPDDVLQARTLARWLRETKRLRIALVYQASRYGREGARAMTGAFEERGGRVLARIEVPPGQKNYGPTAARIQALSVDAVVLWTLYQTGAQLTKDLRRAGHSKLICGPDGIATDAFVDLAGNDAEGVVLTSPFRPERLGALAETFRLRYAARTGLEADSFAAHGYELGHLIHHSLLRSGYDRKAFRDALACTRDFWGITGPLRFDEQGNLIAEVHLAEIRGGRRRPLAPPSAAPRKETP